MKHFNYLKYLLKHKWYVGLACFSSGLYWRGIVHDLSKFHPKEWLPYVESFYGPKHTDEEVREMNRQEFQVMGTTSTKTKAEKRLAFDYAWLRHQHKNPHHWQYWVLRNDDGSTRALEMPVKDAQEMLCDWEGAGMAICGKREYREWYLKNREKMLLHPATRELIERDMFPAGLPV